MKRNNNIDVLKFFCAFLVVCIHATFPQNINKYVLPISRIAVPIFFMITGYFYSNIVKYNKQKSQLKKIFKIFILSNAFFMIIGLFKNIITNSSISLFFYECFNLKSIIKFIIFNQSPFAGHLWYISAILYVLFIIFIIEKKLKRNKLYFIIPFLLICDLCLGIYSILLFDIEFPVILVRNFLFIGLPYFLIGDLLFYKKVFVKNKYSLILILFFVFTTFCENNILNYFNLSSSRDHYISTIFLSVFLFLFVNNIKIKDNYLSKIISFIGNKLSLYIYIIHIFLLHVIDYFKLLPSSLYVFKPIIIFIISIILSYIYYNLLEFIKSNFKEKILK